MMVIEFSQSYEKRAIKFFKKHKDIYPQYKKTLQILQHDPYHPSLRLHKLQGRVSHLHSISIHMKYRITLEFIIEDDRITLIDIGAHKDLY